MNQLPANLRQPTDHQGIEVVIDMLGSPVADPAAPTAELAKYHARLEVLGFERTVLRPDYRFASVDESIELLDWFFGLGDWAREHQNAVVPEFTGWWERRSWLFGANRQDLVPISV